jgi:hypothetical protein
VHKIVLPGSGFNTMSAVGCGLAAGICLLAGLAAVRKLQNLTAATSNSELHECVAFLQQHLPERDKGKVDHEMLLHHARLALKARRANSWAASVPWDIFLNDVLPYRNLDEPIDIDWRSLFFKRFGPIVAAAGSLTEAAQLLNRCAWPAWQPAICSSTIVACDWDIMHAACASNCQHTQ